MGFIASAPFPSLIPSPPPPLFSPPPPPSPSPSLLRLLRKLSNRLLLKLYYYGIRGTNLTWIQSWLTNRTQQVLLEGKNSRKTVVRSGDPQGTVLGPLCFLLFINDIGNGMCSTLKLFADDTLLYGLVHNNQDAIQLQEDLDKLTAWAQPWQMNIPPIEMLCTED